MMDSLSTFFDRSRKQAAIDLGIWETALNIKKLCLGSRCLPRPHFLFQARHCSQAPARARGPSARHFGTENIEFCSCLCDWQISKWPYSRKRAPPGARTSSAERKNQHAARSISAPPTPQGWMPPPAPPHPPARARARPVRGHIHKLSASLLRGTGCTLSAARQPCIHSLTPSPPAEWSPGESRARPFASPPSPSW